MFYQFRSGWREALFFLLAVGLISASSIGCSAASSLLKAQPAERAGFIPNAVPLVDDRGRYPFHGTWYRQREYFYQRRDEAKKIVILPVRTDFLLEKGWWSKLNTFDRSSYETDVKEMAELLRAEIIKAFGERGTSRWEIVEERNGDALIFEFALVELVATKVHINALGTALGFFVTGGGLVSSTAGGSIAIEAKIYDGRDGELLLAYADREADKLAVATLRDYQFYAHARQAVRDWAEQVAELAHTDSATRVADSYPVTAYPW